MTEAEWLACDLPQVLLGEYLARSPTADRARDRKLRLFACACARQVWHLLEDERSKKAVEIAERYADSPTFGEELIFAHHAAVLVRRGAHSFEAELAYKCAGSAEGLAANGGLPRWFSVSTKFAREQTALLRDVIGDPFRPLTIDSRIACTACGRENPQVQDSTFRCLERREERKEDWTRDAPDWFRGD